MVIAASAPSPAVDGVSVPTLRKWARGRGVPLPLGMIPSSVWQRAVAEWERGFELGYLG